MIKNQSFTPYVSNGQNITLCYNVRVKRQIDQAYSVMYTPEFTYPAQSTSDYTTLTYTSIQVENKNDFFVLGGLCEQTPPDTNVSFEVQAMIGSLNNPYGNGDLVFNGTESGWSSPQTVTMPGSNHTSNSFHNRSEYSFCLFRGCIVIWSGCSTGCCNSFVTFALT